MDSLLEYIDTKSLVATSIVTFGALCYCYDRYYFNYWRRKGVPGPPASFFLGNILDAPTGHLSLFHMKMYQKYGPIYGLYIFKEKVLAIHDAHIVKSILITDHLSWTDRTLVGGDPLEALTLLYKNGTQWKRDRAILSKTFSSGKMKSMYPLMKTCYTFLENELTKASNAEKDVNSKELFSNLTSMVIARCAFATHVDAFSDTENKLIKCLRKFAEMSLVKGVAVNVLPKWFLKTFKIGIFDSSSTQYIASVCREIIKQREDAAGSGKVQSYDDLLQIMKDARDEKGQGMSDEQIVSNAVFFFAAGHGTTSALLTWISYVLAKHPQVQEKLHGEVKRAKERTGSLDYETLFELKYLDAVVNETLRLHTPVSMQLRVNVNDYELPSGLLLEKGTTVHIPSHAIHHNPKYFKDPDTFDPERFTGARKESIDSCTFLPFSLGPRNCLGMRFALLETKMTIAEIVSKFKLEMSERQNQVELVNHPIIVEPQTMFLRVHRRLDS